MNDCRPLCVLRQRDRSSTVAAGLPSAHPSDRLQAQRPLPCRHTQTHRLRKWFQWMTHFMETATCNAMYTHASEDKKTPLMRHRTHLTLWQRLQLSTVVPSKRRQASQFLSFPDVCPESVLAKTGVAKAKALLAVPVGGIDDRAACTKPSTRCQPQPQPHQPTQWNKCNPIANTPKID
jgi:hypothetical protein